MPRLRPCSEPTGRRLWASGWRRTALLLWGVLLWGVLLWGMAWLGATPALAQGGRPIPRPPPDARGEMGGPGAWARIDTVPGPAVDTRPFPPRLGRNRCIAMNGVGAAQLFGDIGLEVSMRDGRHFRIFFARECAALSFYQGFYYRRTRAGQLCAGRDVIGARSGGECKIASIIQVRQFRR